MYVLTRKLRQAVVINDKTTITIHEIRGNRVSLLIDAPDDVEFEREEARRPPDTIQMPPLSSHMQKFRKRAI